ncbi:MAG: biotin-dependent carboxyltransferase family protein [Mycobacteriales bacterium]
MLRVERTGPLALVEDGGRPGLAHLGVGCSGAADPLALAEANAAVGNHAAAAGLEVLLGGLVLRALAPVVVAVGPMRRSLTGGDTVTVEPGGALRQYVAVRGGVDVPAVLGSRSRDTLGDLGPAPLAVGDILRAGDALGSCELASHDGLVRLHPGPRADHFHPGTLELLATATWTAAATSDRTAVRLEGPALIRRTTEELPPEGLLPGAVQVPPSGQPIVFLVDHPVTGGYPVIGIVERADLRVLAQTPPGGSVRFTATW